MSDMDPTPAPILETNTNIEKSFCSVEEQNQRLEICKNCNRFWISEEDRTYCLEASKSIAFVITEKSVPCPLGKFE